MLSLGLDDNIRCETFSFEFFGFSLNLEDEHRR